MDLDQCECSTLQGATEDAVTKAVVAVRKAKLSEREESDGAKRVSVTETGGDILVIPQATLGQQSLCNNFDI